jgi:hypothetical protein
MTVEKDREGDLVTRLTQIAMNRIMEVNKRLGGEEKLILMNPMQIISVSKQITASGEVVSEDVSYFPLAADGSGRKYLVTPDGEKVAATSESIQHHIFLKPGEELELGWIECREGKLTIAQLEEITRQFET